MNPNKNFLNFNYYQINPCLDALIIKEFQDFVDYFHHLH